MKAGLTKLAVVKFHNTYVYPTVTLCTSNLHSIVVCHLHFHGAEGGEKRLGGEDVKECNGALRKREATLHSDPKQDKEGSPQRGCNVSQWDKSKLGTTQKDRGRVFMWGTISHHHKVSEVLNQPALPGSN